MPEWQIERGIGEDRALLIEGDRVLAAKCRWPGEVHAGQDYPARLIRKTGSRGLGALPSGREVWLDKLPRSASEGEMLPITITRAAMTERGRLKLPAARPAEQVAARPADVFSTGKQVYRFPTGLWEDVWADAWSGSVTFNEGELLLAVTPAMTVVDVDGDHPARELALLAAKALADALPRFDLGGSICVDFPTLEAKADRKAIDSALEDALDQWPHERTAMNGFGLVQIVARMEGPSLLHRMATSRVGAAARTALRRAELVEGPGATLLTIHPALKAKLHPDWLAELERRTARPLHLETDPTLAIEAATAQIVPHDT